MYNLWYVGTKRVKLMPGGPYTSRQLAAKAASKFIAAGKLSGYAITPVDQPAPQPWGNWRPFN